ncbi:hypothetical protein N9937_01680 [bacterium]|nr:hypothetical protein [bacterium]
MSWAMAAGTGISIGMGILGGKKKKKAAKKARAEQAALRAQQQAVAQEQMDWSRGEYDKNAARYDPIFDEMRDQMDDLQPDYEGIAGDIGSSFDSARGMEERRNRRYGIKPTDGASQQAQRDYGIRRGAAHVGARAEARRGIKDQKYSRRADLFGQGQRAQAGNKLLMAGAFNTKGNAYGIGAVEAGQEAGRQDQNAANTAAGWGQIGSSVAGMDWSSMFNAVKGGGTGAIVAGSGGKTPQQFYGG